jgi:hypothetical protein
MTLPIALAPHKSRRALTSKASAETALPERKFGADISNRRRLVMEEFKS